jgi:hypothetical protein
MASLTTREHPEPEAEEQHAPGDIINVITAISNQDVDVVLNVSAEKGLDPCVRGVADFPKQWVWRLKVSEQRKMRQVTN